MRVLPGTNETLWFSILDGAGEQGNDGGEETQANDRDRHAAEDGKVSTQLDQEQDHEEHKIRTERIFLPKIRSHEQHRWDERYYSYSGIIGTADEGHRQIKGYQPD